MSDENDENDENDVSGENSKKWIKIVQNRFFDYLLKSVVDGYVYKNGNSVYWTKIVQIMGSL